VTDGLVDDTERSLGFPKIALNRMQASGKMRRGGSWELCQAAGAVAEGLIARASEPRLVASAHRKAERSPRRRYKDGVLDVVRIPPRVPHLAGLTFARQANVTGGRHGDYGTDPPLFDTHGHSRTCGCSAFA
jgi:hypothetical protein